ncbi:L-threonine aldolase [Saccharopolyspora kobensis]|uniref:L-threonine aldolase n=1 Tax=Saccharopolyspora kobensis TaxID=146035 RepID=A0A1H6E8B3_9PSEU|nr:beta-eliminating lyase-related protein [Saccharopolyspora kobensis]SEG93095.1 L-threonine aldolase [Saccharopolyspora kobensis]SFD42701.1 L-threonine aldolase [Saccharopolyspora kobensis]
MGGSVVRRSLALHSVLRLKPHDLLRQWADLVGPETLPEEPVAVLEARIAELVGTPAALFFPTGAMAQQVALRVHAQRRGRWTFAGHPHLHLDNWELQGYNAVHGLRFHPVGDRNQLLRKADLAAVGEPLAAVVWELPQRDLGGLLPEWEQLCEQVDLVRSRGAAVHLDGGRIFEAQPFYDRPHAEIAGLFDTVYVSLYKGLQGVRGAVLAGDEETVAEAAVWRKRLGGAIPNAWPLALGALAGLDRLVPRMAEFRDHAVAIAAALNADGTVRVFPDPPQTPLFHVHVPAAKAAVERAGARMLAETGTQLFIKVRSSPDPSRCSFEITVGENAMEFDPDEVVELARDLVNRAQAG